MTKEYTLAQMAKYLEDGGMEKSVISANIRKFEKSCAELDDIEFEEKITKLGGVEAVSGRILSLYNEKKAKKEAAKMQNPVQTPEQTAEAQDETEAEAADARKADEDNSPSWASKESARDGQADTAPGILTFRLPEEQQTGEPATEASAEASEESAEDSAEKPTADLTQTAEDDGGENADQKLSDTEPDGDEDNIAILDGKKRSFEEYAEQSDDENGEADKFFTSDDENVKPDRIPKGASENDVKRKPKKNGPKKTKVVSQKAKATFIVGLIILMPFILTLVISVTALFLALYAVVILLVIAFSAALVVVAAGGTAISLVAIVYGVIQLATVAPVGLYEMGLGVLAGAATLAVSILLYNFIVRLAPYLFKKMFVLYKFLCRQFARLIKFAKGACYKL